MTNEEARVFIQERIDLIDNYYPEVKDYRESLNMAIKALEQESVLDKIRTKIENHCGIVKENHCRYCSYCNNLMGVREILNIIDKYKESEENDDGDNN